MFVLINVYVFLIYCTPPQIEAIVDAVFSPAAEVALLLRESRSFCDASSYTYMCSNIRRWFPYIRI